MNGCPHCGAAVFRKSSSGEKLKAKTRILVLHQNGDVEINCAGCGKGILLPLVVASGSKRIRRAPTPKLVMPKG